MIRYILAALLFATPAWAQTGNLSGGSVKATGTSTSLTAAQWAALPGTPVEAMGAQGNAVSHADGTMSAASSTLTSASATFVAGDVGKRICVQGSGTSGATQCGTISARNSATSVTVSFTSVQAVPWYSVARAPLTIATAQSGAGSYAPADTITLTGGTASSQAVLTVAATQVVSATVAAGGSGGTTGACTMTGTTGTGIKFTASGTVAAGAISGAITIVTSGIYSINPTVLTAEPVTGCSLTGAQLDIKMGPQRLTFTSGGNYSVFPSNPVAQGSTSGSGTGFTLTATQQQAGSGLLGGGHFVYGTDDTSAINAAIALSTKNVIFDGRKSYILNGALSPANYQTLAGRNGKAALYQTHATLSRTLVMTGTVGATVSGFDIKNYSSLTDLVVLLNSGATGNTASDLVIDDGPAFSVGAIVISSASSNTIERISMRRAAATCIGITGATAQYNTIRDVTVLDCGSFGVRLGESANRNLISNISTYRNGHELVGLAWGANYNTITNSYAQDTGDNGFSVSGDFNTLTGNRAHAVAKAGFGVWGSFNSLAGNVATNNNQWGDLATRWSGFWVANGYGGCGSYNSINGTTDDTQTQRTQSYGMSIAAQGYTQWAAGQSITVGLYRYHNTNVYVATSAGTTSATAPTCTSGTCSDGAVTWGFRNACIQQVNANNNVLAGAAGRSYYGSPFQDTASGGLRNTIYGNRYTAVAPIAPGYVNIQGLPTSAAGLASGTLWNNLGILNIAP